MNIQPFTWFKKLFQNFLQPLNSPPKPGRNEILIHYYRFDQDYEGWNLWFWHPHLKMEGVEILPEGIGTYGLIFRIHHNSIQDLNGFGFVLKRGEWQDKEIGDRFIHQVGKKVFYVLAGKRKISTRPPSLTPPISEVFLDSPEVLHVVFPYPVLDWKLNDFFFKLESSSGSSIPIKDYSLLPPDANSSIHARVILQNPLPVKINKLSGFRLGTKDHYPRRIQPRGVLYHPQLFSQKPLGCRLEKNHFCFGVFAPTAESVSVRLYEGIEEETHRDFPMTRDDCGVWETKISFSTARRKLYRYRIFGADFPSQRIRLPLDPYSKGHTHHLGKSFVFDPRELPISKISPSPKIPREKTIIYEMHLRDFTIHPESGIKKKGTFLGLTEERSHLPGRPELSTGLAHLKELGINTIQIMPLQDFDNLETGEDYNWGYMPTHYFCPDGSFSSNPKSLARVLELRDMVSELHRNGFQVILDVVYNHTWEGNSDQSQGLNGTAPGYYYRRRHDGSYFNGSGCGNEFKSEALMARRMIVDSLSFFVQFYGFDGFRFDLLGLMDYETTQVIETELKKIKPEIFLYGEPWAGGQAGIEVLGKGFQKGRHFGVFNDSFRNALIGNVFNSTGGFLQGEGKIQAIKEGVLGGISTFSDSPLESINYFSCHDNRTFFDRITHTTEKWTLEQTKRSAKCAIALLMCSQGIPFFLSGEEILRTKKGDENSYNSGDLINQIDWPTKLTHLEIFHFYRQMIALRTQLPHFTLKTREEVQRSVSFLDEQFHHFHPKCLGFQVDLSWKPGEQNQGRVIALFNPTHHQVPFEIPHGKWVTLVENFRVTLQKRDQKEISRNKITLNPLSFLLILDYPKNPTEKGKKERKEKPSF